MDDGKLFRPAASTKPTTSPSLEWAVDNFVEKFWYFSVFSFLMMDIYSLCTH
jgi:hypothetical protein